MLPRTVCSVARCSAPLLSASGMRRPLYILALSHTAPEPVLLYNGQQHCRNKSSTAVYLLALWHSFACAPSSSAGTCKATQAESRHATEASECKRGACGRDRPVVRTRLLFGAALGVLVGAHHMAFSVSVNSK